MEIDDKIFKEMAELLKPAYYGNYMGRMFTLTEVKLLCIDAMMYFMEKQGEDKIDVNEFYKLKGL